MSDQKMSLLSWSHCGSNSHPSCEKTFGIHSTKSISNWQKRIRNIEQVFAARLQLITDPYIPPEINRIVAAFVARKKPVATVQSHPVSWTYFGTIRRVFVRGSYLSMFCGDNTVMTGRLPALETLTEQKMDSKASWWGRCKMFVDHSHPHRLLWRTDDGRRLYEIDLVENQVRGVMFVPYAPALATDREGNIYHYCNYWFLDQKSWLCRWNRKKRGQDLDYSWGKQIITVIQFEPSTNQIFVASHLGKYARVHSCRTSDLRPHLIRRMTGRIRQMEFWGSDRLIIVRERLIKKNNLFVRPKSIWLVDLLDGSYHEIARSICPIRSMSVDPQSRNVYLVDGAKIRVLTVNLSHE